MSLTPPVGTHDHAQGDAHAPITLVEYGDFECPYCGAAYPVVKKLQQHFGKQLRFVFRNFPLTQIHPYAELAAESAEVADGAGKFWEMHDMLFEQQRALAEPDLVRYAKSLGMDPGSVEKALQSHEKLARVKSDFMSGVRSGVNGTPSFFINGEKYEGAYDVASLQEAITTVAASLRGA